MTAASSKSNRKTSKGTRSATSSPASVDGAKPSNLPGGNQKDLFGQDLVHAPRSQARARKKHARRAVASVLSHALDELATSYAELARTHGLPMPVISGQSSGVSSPSRALQKSLENRLVERMERYGSLEFGLRWNWLDTPLGPPILQRQALGLRTSDNDFFGWPTASASDADRGGKEVTEGMSGTSLTQVAGMAGWPSPMAGTPATETNNAAGNNDSSRITVALVAGWPTAKAKDGREWSPGAGKDSISGKGLGAKAQLTGWATPSSRDWKDTEGMSQTGTNPDGSLRVRVDQLPRQANLASGTTMNSSPAETAKHGVLNPVFVCWLQGYSGEWLSCVDWATLSSRKSPPSSSPVTGKE